MRLSGISSRPTLLLGIGAVVLFALGLGAGVFVAKVTEPGQGGVTLDQIKTAAPAAAPTGIFTATPDTSLNGKEAALKDIGREPTKYNGITVSTKGKIVQLDGQQGEFLRDPEKYTIALDWSGYQGAKASFNDVLVKVTGEVQFSMQSPEPLKLKVKDIQKAS